MNKSLVKNRPYLRLFLFLLLLIVPLGFLYKEKYLNCIVKNFSLCITSKKYTSAKGQFSFRYPKDYPITFKTGDDLRRVFGFGDGYVEWVNFSSEFYPNAGGDRLGSIIVNRNNSYQSVKQFGDEELNNFNKLTEQYKGIPPKIKIEYLKLGGADSVRVSVGRLDFNPPKDDYLLIHNGDLYRIGFNYNDYYHKQPLRYYEGAKEVILSTFTLN